MIHLVTDSTAYLPPPLLDKWNIHTVSLKVTMGTQTLDEDKIPQQDFYSYLDNVATAPTTSQPPPGEFIELYQSLLNNGDEILSVHISSGLSGTPLVAEMAAQDVSPERITVIDSRTTTCPLGLIILAAAEAIKKGASRAETIELIRKLTPVNQGIFLVRSLDYLAKGGRINGAAKFLGNVLNVRPILYLHKGKIEGLGLSRTRKRGLKQILNEIEKRLGAEQPIYTAVTHIQAQDEAQALAEEVRQRFNCGKVLITETGPVIGSHVGPGFIGVAACPMIEV